jgi:hypothetical protein
MKQSPNSAPPRLIAAGLSTRQFLAIVVIFWLFVTLSNVLYAYSMSVGVAKMTDAPLFAAWNVRVLQHLILLPVLLISYWASLRIKWHPLGFAVPLQVLLGAVFAAVAYPAMFVAHEMVGGHEAMTQVMAQAPTAWLEESIIPLWLASFLSFVPAYGFGLALVTGLALYRRFHDSELQVAELERQWSAARLSALRMQLSPHTLFNLLHTIRGNIEWDPRTAQSMVVKLADLLRRLLNAGERDYARLADELQLVTLYLELQQRRFVDRLAVHVPDAAAVPSLWIPSLILQPLIENAVIHGLAAHQGPVQIHLSVEACGETLRLCVRNTVSPLTPVNAGGIGLKNVRERLAVQYSNRARLVTDRTASEWCAEISMPAQHELPRSRESRIPAGADA